MKSFRATPGVQVVVLNHPRDLHSDFRPFDPVNFNAVTGENLRGGAFSFDALEVLNSGAHQSDFMRLYHDWFALLNGGHRVTSVGSSDSHDVDGYIVGQGRTFIAYDRDHEPSSIDISEACRNLLRGRAFVSMGLLTRMTIEGKFGVGDLAAVRGRRMRVTVSVLGPSWTSADRVELFANGVKIRGREVTATAGAVEKAKVTWTLPRPSHDVHLVAIASGPGITAPHWPMARPSQPTSATWNPRVIGSTNPVWVDADGDGRYTHPRAYAATLVERSGADLATLLRGLAPYDQAVAAQAASLYSAAGHDLRDKKFQRLLNTSAAAVRRGFDLYTATLPHR
jgi:hypothetical protein